MKYVSVILVNYNGEPFIKRLLLSLTNQTYKDFEIIFVDNASTDHSVKIFQEMLRHLQLEDIHVKIILNKENLGYCKGNNVGLKHAQGSYIVFLNNDTYLSTRWLEELVKVLDRYQSVGACQSKILFADTGELQALGNSFDVYGVSVKPFFDSRMGIDVLIDAFFCPSGTSMIVRREVLDKCGGFDEKLFYGDRDLGWRVRLFGYRMAMTLRSVCYHYGSYATKTLFPSVALSYFEYRDRIRILTKNYSFSRLVVRLPLSIFMMFIESAYSTLKFRTPCVSAWFKAILWNILNLRDTIKKRIEMQKKRTVSDDEIEKYMNPYPSLVTDFKRKISYLLEKK